MTDLGSVSHASYCLQVIADHYTFANFFAVALHERLGSLRNLGLLSLHHFVRPPLSQVRGLIPAFTLPLSFHSMTIMDDQSKQMNMNHFHLFCFSGPSAILHVILGVLTSV